MCIQNNVMTVIPPLEHLLLLSDSRASGALLHSGSTKVPHLEEVNTGVKTREGKGSASLVATQSIFIQPVEEEVPCCFRPSKNRAHTGQTKAAECQAGLSLPCHSRYLRVRWGGWQRVIIPVMGTPASVDDCNLYRSL